MAATPRAATGIATTFGIGLGPDNVINTPDDCDPSGCNTREYNFGAVSSFTPAAFLLNQVPTGAVVGRVEAIVRLGLLNNNCQQYQPYYFDLINATIDTTSSWTEPPTSADGVNWPGWKDDDNDGLINVIEMYPPMLNIVFPTLQPVARVVGINTSSAPGFKALLHLVFFRPGEILTNVFPTPRPELGLVAVVLLGDPTLSPTPSLFTDFCAPISARVTYYGVTVDNACTPAATPPCPFEQPQEGATGAAPDESGHLIRPNPPFGGTLNFYLYARSQRDADQDGIENALDTCPFTPTPDYNPRLPNHLADTANDPDEDGIPGGGPAGGCDPTPNGPTEPVFPCYPIPCEDHDGDHYYNTADNCPLVQNGVDTKGSAEVTNDVPVPDVPLDHPQSNPSDDDRDGIGDGCDPNPNVPDGHFHEEVIEAPISIVGPAPGDSDGDGTSDDYELLVDSNPSDANSRPEHGVAGTCSDGLDNDEDGWSDLADTGCGFADSDEDLSSDSLESRTGSDRLDPAKQPEHPLNYRSCVDGLDNDTDSTVDAADSGCAFADSDADGVLDGIDNCATVANFDQNNTDGDGQGNVCDRDDDNDSNLPTAYSECKGPCPGGYWHDRIEEFLYTSSTDRCADTTTVNDEFDDKWPPDFDDNRSVDVVDFNIWRASYASPPKAWNRRADLDANYRVNILDFGAWKAYFGATCSP
jgi:hypothetical protein